MVISCHKINDGPLKINPGFNIVFPFTLSKTLVLKQEKLEMGVFAHFRLYLSQISIQQNVIQVLVRAKKYAYSARLIIEIGPLQN